MKRIILLLAAALLALGLVPAPASAQADASVTVADAVTYNYPAEPFPITFCFDGVAQNMQVGDIVGPSAVSPGTYTVGINEGASQGCASYDYSEDITLNAGDDVTILLGWPIGGREDISVLPNDTSCVEPGTGRVTLRNGASTQGPVDLISDTTTLIANVAEMGQGSADLAAGDYPNTIADDGFLTIADLGTMTVNEGEHLVIYLAGGNDGPSGAFTDTLDLDVCTQPTTTTTSTTIPTTTTTVARAVAATPAFTG